MPSPARPASLVVVAPLLALTLASCEPPAPPAGGPPPEADASGPAPQASPPALPFDRYLREQARQGQFSGTALVALADTVFERSYGIPGAPGGMRVTDAHRYPLGELGQLLVRAAYFRLADQGRITLNAAVAEALPALPQNSAVNYRMLLDHRAGLPEVLPEGTPLEEVELLGQPGTVERYSPLGYDLLARLLGERLGTSAAEAIRVLVLEPAGMTATTVLDPRGPPADWARGYRVDGGDLEAVAYGDAARANRDGVPAYASTAADLLYLAQWLPRGAYPRDGLQVVGSRPGYRAFFRGEPGGERVVVGLANVATPEWSRIAGDLVAMAEGGQVALPRPVYRQAIDLPAGVEAFAGRYQLAGAGEYVIAYAGDSLAITGPDGVRQRLYAESDTHFFTSPYARETVRLVPATTLAGPRVSVVTAAGREVVLAAVGGR